MQADLEGYGGVPDALPQTSGDVAAGHANADVRISKQDIQIPSMDSGVGRRVWGTRFEYRNGVEPAEKLRFTLPRLVPCIAA